MTRGGMEGNKPLIALHMWKETTLDVPHVLGPQLNIRGQTALVQVAKPPQANLNMSVVGVLKHALTMDR
jgi:hypothetical protein